MFLPFSYRNCAACLIRLAHPIDSVIEIELESAMEDNTSGDAQDISAIRKVMRQELSLAWEAEAPPDWELFEGTFLPLAALFPAARPVKAQTLGQFVERMKQLRETAQLTSFHVKPLGCEVLVFGNVAVAFAACELLENESNTTREVNATILVRENDKWLIAAQAWDVENGTRQIPTYLDNGVNLPRQISALLS